MSSIVYSEYFTATRFLRRLEDMGVDLKFKQYLMHTQHQFHDLVVRRNFVLIVDNRGTIQRKVIIEPSTKNAQYIWNALTDKDFLQLDDEHLTDY